MDTNTYYLIGFVSVAILLIILTKGGAFNFLGANFRFSKGSNVKLIGVKRVKVKQQGNQTTHVEHSEDVDVTQKDQEKKEQ